MSCQLTQQMSCLQTQQMSCLQAHCSRFCPIQPEMIFGCNLQHMALFGIPTTGLCMVFRCATLIFSNPDPKSGAWKLQTGPEPFGGKQGNTKNMILWSECFPWGFMGICKREMDCMVPRKPLGKPFPPNKLPESPSVGISGFREKFRSAPGSLSGDHNWLWLWLWPVCESRG